MLEGGEFASDLSPCIQLHHQLLTRACACPSMSHAVTRTEQPSQRGCIIIDMSPIMQGVSSSHLVTLPVGEGRCFVVRWRCRKSIPTSIYDRGAHERVKSARIRTSKDLAQRDRAYRETLSRNGAFSEILVWQWLAPLSSCCFTLKGQNRSRK